jgi:hypothetical protein
MLGGCGGSGKDTATDQPSKTPAPGSTSSTTTKKVSSTTQRTGPVISNGAYAKTVTLQQANALGITRATRAKYLGHGGQMPLKVIFKIEGSTFSVFESSGGRPPELGDSGSAAYPAPHRWTNDDGQGGVVTYAWNMKGGTLRLRVLKDTIPGDTGQTLKVVRLITEGTFRRQ